MKVLYHHRIRSKDGQYVHLSEMVQALEEAGHEVKLVGPAIVDEKPFGESGGWIGSLKKHCPLLVYELLELGYALLDCVRLAAAVRRMRPDVIYERYNLFLPSGIWIKTLFSIPLLLEINAPLADERARYGGLALRAWARRIEDYTWRNADAVLPVTAVLGKIVAARGVPPGRIHVIRNGVNSEDIAHADGSAVDRMLDVSDGQIVIGFVGFLRDWHGLDRVVNLLAKAGNERLRFLVVGDGPARRTLEQLGAKLAVSDRMTITGVVERSEILDYVARFDIALQPDVVDYASPLKLVEYMALGRPVIAPDKENIREFIDHAENGWLFSLGEENAFEDAVAVLARDADLRRRLGSAARATVESRGLTWRHNAERAIAIAKSLCDTRAEARA